MNIIRKRISIALTVLTLNIGFGTSNSFAQKIDSIYGTGTVCQGQKSVVYMVNSVANTTDYTWTYSGTGFSIVSGAGTNGIMADFSDNATPGTLSVYATNACGGVVSSPPFSITMNPLPAAAGNITGTSNVTAGQTGVVYSVPSISGATKYTWTYSGYGATIAGTTDSVVIDFSVAASCGDLTVVGTNSCGNGTVSATFPITVTNSCFRHAVGGTITYDGDYEIHTFTSSGTFTATNWCAGDVEYLIVGGGGAGGYSCIGGGGGGGGGVLTGTLPITAGIPFTVTVGAGGSGAHTGSGGSNAWTGNKGGNSTFSTVTAYGGGGGGGQDGCSASNVGQPGGAGASGGGGTSSTNNVAGALGGKGGTATPSGQGNVGGDGATKIVGSSSNAGGGGGAGAPGSNGVCGANKGGAGGAGIASSISGTSVYYGGGGGGSAGGAGGIGGGGANGASGAANTGGGGGGGTGSAGSGGSGIVILTQIMH